MTKTSDLGMPTSRLYFLWMEIVLSFHHSVSTQNLYSQNKKKLSRKTFTRKKWIPKHNTPIIHTVSWIVCSISNDIKKKMAKEIFNRMLNIQKPVPTNLSCSQHGLFILSYWRIWWVAAPSHTLPWMASRCFPCEHSVRRGLQTWRWSPWYMSF